jgi:acetyltransferase
MSADQSNYEAFFYPNSIAVIGASESLHSFGARYMEALLSFGYIGRLYAVNHKGEEVLGHKIYRSMLDIPDPVDMAVFCVSGRFVPAILKECLEKGVRSATILSSGFSEIGDKGRAIEQQIVEIAEKGMSVLGPNCFGVYCPSGKITIIPGGNFPRESGPVSLIAQSGQFSEMMVMRTFGEGVRFSKVVSYGNACDINESDLLEYLVRDDATKVIAFYLEGVKDGRRFFDLARRASGKKPLLIWKAGLTSMGSAAASSHTGSMAGERTAWDAFFQQSHAIEIGSLDEFSDTCVGFSCLPEGCGTRIGLVSGGGAGAVVGADACERAGLSMPPFSADVLEKLKTILPSVGTAIKNPLDIGVPHLHVDILESILEAVASCTDVDVVIVRRVFLSVKTSQILAGKATAPPDEEAYSLMEVPVRIKEKYGKPVVIILPEELTGIDSLELEEERRRLRDFYFTNGIPVYKNEVQAFAALSRLAKFKSQRGREYQISDKTTSDEAPSVASENAISIILRKSETSILSEIACKEILKQAGVNVIETKLAITRNESIQMCESIGFPAGMKIVSPQITHKSDAGGVVLGIENGDEAGEAFDRIMATVKENHPSAVIEGVAVQRMAEQGTEVVIGMTRDPQFGPMLMFGLGGIFVEIIRDVAFRIAPLTAEDAGEMIREIKGYRLLEGYRGQAPVDISHLEKLLLKISKLAHNHPDIKEMDINPIMAYSKGAVAVDARILLESENVT